MSVTTTAVPTGTWSVDPSHSKVGFAVKHMGIATVRGVFRDFSGTLEIGDEVRAHGTVQAASVDTNDGQRDEHLRSADFFDVERHPRLAFAATAIEPVAEDRLRIVGDLTIRGVTRSIELTAEVLGTGIDDEGATRIGLDIAGTLDRRDFGLTWNSVVDGGGMLVGNRVDLRLEVSALRRA